MRVLPLPCPRCVTAARVVLALILLAGASYNGLVTLRAPAFELARLIALSPFSFVRDLATAVAMPHPTAFVLLVVVFEVAIAGSVLLTVSVRRGGYAACLLFFVVLAPLIGWYGLSNLTWAVPAVLLLRYDRSATEEPSRPGT